MPSLRCQDRQNQCHLPIIPHTIELCIPVKKYPTPAYMPKWGLLLFHVKILLYPVYYDIFPRSSDCIRLFQYHVQPLHHLSTPDILRLPLIDHPEIILLDPVTVNLLQQFPKASLVQIRKMPWYLFRIRSPDQGSFLHPGHCLETALAKVLYPHRSSRI